MNFRDFLPGRPGGVRVPHHKSTANCETVTMPVPVRITLPMVQHLGAPCNPMVKVGDTVSVGQVVADSDAAICAPIHSGVSGTVTAVSDAKMPDGRVFPAVTIDSDGEQRIFEGIAPPVINNYTDFLAAVRASGLVGLGGAGFPAHIKLNPPNRSEIDTIVINAAECEPYITTDYRECRENSWDILSGVQTLMEFLDAQRVIIAIERNKPAAISTLSRIARDISTPERRVMVKALPSRYPQGAEKVLIYACTGRRVPPGKLPGDVGCLVMNVTSTAFLSRYLKTGIPLISRRITVDGGAIQNPQNLRVIIGTPIKDVLDACGVERKKIHALIMGGPMMGTALMDDSAMVLKQNNAVLALTAKESPHAAENACMRCGKCISACPMRLAPPVISGALGRHDIDALEKLAVMSCMECGCCAWSCPSGRFLTQTMRMAKDAVREKERR